MSKSYKISIIGAGNLSWHLAPALEAAGHLVKEIYSRDISKATTITSRLYHAVPKDDLDFSASESNVFILSISDNSIKEVAGQLQLPKNVFVAHTSGTTDIDTLEKFENTAVLYPLQTFSKSRKIAFTQVPICLEAGNEVSRQVFEQIAQSISRDIRYLDSEKRKGLHLAAVFACNFTNHLLGIASHILQCEDLPSNILHAIISETINKAMETNPFDVQTGPAVRDDRNTIAAHLHMLADIPEFGAIYRAISESIQEYSSDQKNED